MEVYYLDEWILLHCMLLVSYTQQYFSTSITVLTNQVWKLLIALLKVPNTGALTVHQSLEQHLKSHDKSSMISTHYLKLTSWPLYMFCSIIRLLILSWILQNGRRARVCMMWLRRITCSLDVTWLPRDTPSTAAPPWLCSAPGTVLMDSSWIQ